jgi:exodeoxyribonuclease-3
MRVVSWNINSVRLRLANIKLLYEQSNADVICLQETKVNDNDFPVDAIKQMGFEYVEFCGQKSYNGVAILSRIPMLEINNLHLVLNYIISIFQLGVIFLIPLQILNLPIS